MTRLRARLDAVLRAEDRADDHGYVAVFVALCLPLLVGMCALAVDVATWQVEGTKTQKAADAAALAGTIYLPTSQSTAFSTATDIARVNGFSAANGDTVTVARTSKPTQLRVTITTTVDNAFGVIFGQQQTQVTRTSVADYAGPIPMGSPCNVLGNELMNPAGASRAGSSECDDQAGAFWMNIAGTNTNKARGDGYASGYCTRPDNLPIDACSGTSSSPVGPTTNADYDPSAQGGYLYGVRVSQAGISFDIQGYDLSWVAQGDDCTLGTLDNATAARNPFIPDVNNPADEATRYVKNKGPFCTGDSNMGTPEGDGGTPGRPVPSRVRTIVNVYEPSLTPWNPLNAPLICTLDLPGWDQNTQLRQALNATSAGYDPLLAQHFRRWASVCSVTGAKLGDYTVQIRTIGGGGQNRFAMRAKTTSAATANQVSFFAAGKTSFFNSVPAGTSTFYLARLDSGAAGKILKLDFFDLADASQPVVVTVLQPDSDTPFSGCRAIGPIGGADPGTAITNCTVTTRLSTNGGKWQTIEAPVPAGYTCSNDADAGVCWVRVRLTTSAEQNDTTTWRATLEGDPVRIVE